MAKDTVELLDQVGWTEKRQLHIVGLSMGGMIAQELVGFHPADSRFVLKMVQALMIPERIASLMFLSTAARLANYVVRPPPNISIVRPLLQISGILGASQITHNHVHSPTVRCNA